MAIGVRCVLSFAALTASTLPRLRTKPLAGVEIALVARNNAERTRYSELVARGSGGLDAGSGGNAPIAVMATRC
ncbi:hypothetical protein CCP3SC15_4200002 [Gammaproteobacteria bacterium]